MRPCGIPGGHGVGNQQAFRLTTLVADEQVDQAVPAPGGLQAGRGGVDANHQLGGGGRDRLGGWPPRGWPA
jgi:hypothetical protein